MAWTLEHKEKSRDNILAAAALLFTQQGFDAVSINDVMNEAGLTRGAFYAHFSSKAELYSEAVVCGARLAKEKVQAGADGFDSLVQRYLKIGSGLENNAEYCPLAFLVTDICHRDEQVRSAYTRILLGYQSVLKDFDLNETDAVQASVLMIGGLALSRAVNDDAVRDKIIESSLAGVKALAGGYETS